MAGKGKYGEKEYKQDIKDLKRLRDKHGFDKYEDVKKILGRLSGLWTDLDWVEATVGQYEYKLASSREADEVWRSLDEKPFGRLFLNSIPAYGYPGGTGGMSRTIYKAMDDIVKIVRRWREQGQKKIGKDEEAVLKAYDELNTDVTRFLSGQQKRDERYSGVYAAIILACWTKGLTMGMKINNDADLENFEGKMKRRSPSSFEEYWLKLGEDQAEAERLGELCKDLDRFMNQLHASYEALQFTNGNRLGNPADRMWNLIKKGDWTVYDD